MFKVIHVTHRRNTDCYLNYEMGDENEAVMVMNVHPVIIQVIAKHCIAYLFMRQNDS
jgi:hypothetical protein